MQSPQTLYEWNLINYQLVLLFDAMNGLIREDTNHVPEKDKRLVLDAIKTRAGTTKLIESEEYFLNGTTMEILKPGEQDGFEFCPVATPFPIGIQWINHAFARGIAPLGVSFKPLYYDGAVNNPLRFFVHDGFHYTAWLQDVLRLKADDFTDPAILFEEKEFKLQQTGQMSSKRVLTEQQKEYLSSERKLSTSFMSFIDNDFKGEYFNDKKHYNPNQTVFQCTGDSIHLALFRMVHEESKRLSRLDEICSKDPFERPLFSASYSLMSRSHSNSLLPKELQDGLKEFHQYVNELLREHANKPGYLIQYIDPTSFNRKSEIDDSKYVDIGAYAINAEGCLCKAWEEFKSK